MRQSVLIRFSERDEFDVPLHDADPMAPQAARAWLDDQFVRNGCTLQQASGKVLTADKLLAIAAAVGPAGFADAADRLAQNLYLAAPTVAQHAALAALAPETLAVLDARRDVLRARRDWLRPNLERLGFAIVAPPEGAFYLYADSSGVAPDSYALAERLLEEAGVAVTPGADFGENEARRHLRFAYTTDLERLAEGVRRIAALLGRGGS